MENLLKFISVKNAVAFGNLELVEETLLQHSPQVFDDDGPQAFIRKMMHLACQKGYLDIVKLFVERGVSLEEVALFPDLPPGPSSFVFVTPLQCAIEYNFPEIVSFLLERGANIDTRIKGSPNEETPLELACHCNNVEVVRVLLENGAGADASLFCVVCFLGFLDVAKLLVEFGVHGDEIEKSSDASALHQACRSGNGEMVEWLLDQGAVIEANWAEASRIGWTPLMVSCEYGVVETARVLMNRGANVTARSKAGFTPLYVACTNGGSPEIAQMLLDKGANLEVRTEEELLTPLLGACSKEGKREVVKFLLDRGANLEARGCGGKTALHVAASYDHSDIVDLLLSRGADIKAIDDKGANAGRFTHSYKMAEVFYRHETKALGTDGVTQLHLASSLGSLDGMLLEVLLHRSNGEIDAKTCKGKTALLLACESGYFPIVQLLLNKGANFAAKDKQGWTSLHWASAKGHSEISEMLLEKGADIEAKQRHGWTPLQLACQNDKLKTVQLLVKHGANIHVSGNNGWTLVHIACKFGSLKLARFLVNEGVTLDARNKKDWTPLHIACRDGRLEMVRLLLDQGVNWTVQVNGTTTPERLARKYNHTAIAELLASRE